MVKSSSYLRKFFVVLMSLAIVVAYSVVPFTQSYAATKKPTKITLTTTSKTVDIKGKVTVSVKSVKPAKASKAVKWKSSNKKIATVNSKGVVTGKKKGKVTITATSKSNKKVKKTIKITVKDLKAKSVKLSKKSATLAKGKSLTLKASVSPKGVYAPLTWKSSNTKVAKVNSKGQVTAVAPGTATITASTSKKTAGKAVKASCKITVPEVTPAGQEVKEKDPELGALKSRTMTTVIEMTDETRYPKGHVVEVWVPVPQTDDYQIIENYKLSADKAAEAEFYTEENTGWKNKIAYIKWDENAEPEDRVATITFDADRFEVCRSDLKDDKTAAFSEEAKEYLAGGSRYESKYVKPGDPIVQKYAKEIAGGKSGTVAKARAIYEWCIANLERLDVGDDLGNGNIFENATGCGNGDVVKILTEIDTIGRSGGHCTDINSTFVALCRAAGIPAREMFGIRLNDKSNDGQHCWAEFYLPGTGWTYADPGDVLKEARAHTADRSIEEINKARKDPAVLDKMEALWGCVDNNRIVLSRGRDVKLNPEQNGDLRNTFGYPYAEVDGVQKDAEGAEIDCTKFADFKYTITCAEIPAGDAVLVDARKPEAYAGWAIDGDKNGGHLEGAVNFAAQWLEAPYPADEIGYKTQADALDMALADSGLDRNAAITVYDTNDKDAKVVADFLKSKAFRNVQTTNKSAEINADGAKLESYPNYQLNVPAEVAKNISDNLTNGTALTDEAKAIVGDRDIRIFHAEYCAAGKYTDDGYKENNPIDWTSASGYYKDGHVPGAEPISTDDFEPERYSDRDIIDNAKEGITWKADYLLRNDEELLDLAALYGLQKDDFVLVAGYEPMATAKIALVMKYLGIDNVYVMSGAYTEWNQNGYELEKGVWNKPKTNTTDITAIGNPDVIDTQDEAAAMIEDTEKYQLIDTRRTEEFEGKTSGYTYHDLAGKIPGVEVNSPSGVGHSSSMYFYRNPDSTMRSPEAIKAMWAKQGVDTSKHLSFFCGSGWRAAEETWDAWVMGLDASMYNDGWQGWSNAGRPFIDQEGVTCKVVDGYLVRDIDITSFQYVTAENLIKDIETGDPEYTILDNRQLVDETGSMGSYSDAHIVSAIAAPCVSNGYEFLEDVQIAANLKEAGVKASGNEKYVMVCYMGGEVAEKAVKIAATYLNVPLDRLFILSGGQWSMDPEWSFMSDDPYDAPEYLISRGTSKGGVEYNGVTPEQLKTDLDGAHKIYKVIDVRNAEDYDANHIPTAFSAPVRTGNEDTDAANINAAVKEFGTGAVYCLICYSGNAYADAAEDLLLKAGVPENRITRLIGGQGAWDEAYPAEQLIDFPNLSDEDWEAWGINAGDIRTTDYIIDVRPDSAREGDTATGIVPGADIIPVAGNETTPESVANADKLDAAVKAADGNRIVVICVKGRVLARNTLNYLQTTGVDMDNVTYLIGGFDTWSANYPVVSPDKKSVSVNAWVTQGEGPDGKLLMLKTDGAADPAKADLTHHILVNENGGNAKAALLNTKALPIQVYRGLEEIGGTPCDKFNYADCFVDGVAQNVFLPADAQKINVSFEEENGDVKTLDDYFDHVVTATADITTADAVETEPFTADMRFGGCMENIVNMLEDPRGIASGNQTGCITCTFSCWIGTVSNAAYAYNTQEAKVDRANVPAANSPVKVIYTLGE